MTGAVGRAVKAFCADGGASGDRWSDLPFFRDGTAEAVAAEIDRRIAAGASVLPAPDAIFNALALTPLPTVKVVVLGQDPYPTPGDAHGLAFSFGRAGRLPASLKAILAEMAADLSLPTPERGDLTAWARQGVLLLNTALTVEAGLAGAHARLGWSALADQAVAAVSARRPAAVFMLWGVHARRRSALIDARKHLILEAGHPSPLNRLADYRHHRPFSRANAWLEARGIAPVDWRLG